MGMAGKVIFSVGLLALLASPGLAWWPLGFVLPVIAFCGVLVSSGRDQQLAEERKGESICQFARSFDRRIVDTKIIRAVYEEFSTTFPLRASDRLEDDLRVDGEDLDLGAMEIARRTGRTLDECERNPLFKNVNTLGDLVMFFHHQPLLEASQARQQS